MTDAPVPEKKAKKTDGLYKIPGWSGANKGEMVVRTVTKSNPGEMEKDAKRAVSVGYRVGQRIEISITGNEMTIKLPATGGKVTDEVRKAARRIAPLTDAEKMEISEKKTARRARKASGEAGGGEAKAKKPAGAARSSTRKKASSASEG